jgi:serine/threonine protein kinase
VVGIGDASYQGYAVLDVSDRTKRTRLGVGDRAPKPPDLVGTTVLDTYVVEAELGSGAMGTVFRARHVRLGNYVALKVMHDHLVSEPALLQRFYREAKAAARLAHPNVVSVLDVGETPDGKHVMVMELVDGTSLGDELDAGILPARIIEVMHELLLGLEHAHAAGLVHRDLKPDNVLVDRDGRARIADFGIAALTRPDETADRLTGTGMIVGTPLYMAPEQALGQIVDGRADLYSVGIILYELLAGRPPFIDRDPHVLIRQHAKVPPPSLQSLANDAAWCTRELLALVDGALVKDPAQRFATAGAMTAALDAAFASLDHV